MTDPEAHAVHLVLAQKRDEIVNRFIAELWKEDLAPPDLSRSALVDHIPVFLDEVVAELTLGEPVSNEQDATDTSLAARRHGKQRWSLGYDIEGVIREYGLLRHCILQTLRNAGATVTIDAFDVIAKCLNVGVAEATTAYVKHRDEEVRGKREELEFLAEAGQLLTSSLDYRTTLSRLTSLIVPRLADWAVIHIDGMAAGDDLPLAHILPEKAALLREFYRQFPAPSDWPYPYAEVLKSGESRLVSKSDHEAEPAQVRTGQLHPVSSILVPLKVQNSIFGVIVLAFEDSDRHYNSSHLAFAEELARRAACAIDNAIIYDLSQRERSRVEEATRAKDEFIAMVSHELRNPLSAILGWTKLLRSGSLTEAKREHALEVIERNGHAQNQIVADLLDISRMVTGKLSVDAAPVDLQNVVKVVVDTIRPAAEAKQIRIVLELEPSVLNADSDRLQQVVSNLLTNAVKFTPRDGEIHVALRRVESEVTLTVRDSGKGMEPDFIPHVFDRFRQATPGTRRQGGLGLGLAIAKHIVEIHGGSIAAFSQGIGLGSTFVVTLPVRPMEAAAPVDLITRPAATSKATLTGVADQAANLRVLIVDDEADARDLLASLLEGRHVEVELASSASEALDRLEAFRPDVVVSDVGMPNDDGYTLIRKIRTFHIEGLRQTPVIALTGHARGEDRARALVEGFNVHLAKPVDANDLFATIAELAGAWSRS